MTSVIIIFYNEEKYIEKCIKSVLNQTYKNFEFVLIDDNSTDRSSHIIASLKDERIKYFKNEYHQGISKSRNIGLKKAKGRFVFFTDADCTVDKNWLNEGLKYLLKDYSGVEGRTIYTLQDTSLKHKIIENPRGNLWLTCNMAYTAESINKAGGFNTIYGNHGEDKDLALKVKRHGKIIFNKDMLAYHHPKEWSFKKLIQTHIDHAKTAVYLYKYFYDFKFERFGIIISYRHLLMILFPPLLIYKAFRDKIKNFYEIKLLFVFYLAYLIERYYIWKTAFKEKIFLI